MNYYGDIKILFAYKYEPAGTRFFEHVFDDYYGIQYIHAGKIFVQVDSGPVETADAPVVFITYPGARFSYGSPPHTLRSQTTVCFRGDRVKRYIDSGLLELRRHDFFLRPKDNRLFMNTFDQLTRYTMSPGETAHGMAVLELERLMLFLNEKVPQLPNAAKYARHINDLSEKISETPCSKWDFSSEAEKLSLSLVHFRRIFKAVSGWNPTEFLIFCRIRHAETLLFTTHKRISEIAEECGYSSEFYFSKDFKKHEINQKFALR